MGSGKIIIFSLLLLPLSLLADTAADYATRGAQKYVYGQEAAAKKEVAEGLAKFPHDPELQEMVTLFKDKPPDKKQQQNKNQQNKDQKSKPEDDDQQQQSPNGQGPRISNQRQSKASRPAPRPHRRPLLLLRRHRYNANSHPGESPGTTPTPTPGESPGTSSSPGEGHRPRRRPFPGDQAGEVSPSPSPGENGKPFTYPGRAGFADADSRLRRSGWRRRPAAELRRPPARPANR